MPINSFLRPKSGKTGAFLVLRLVMALVFAIIAVIFSELIPPIEGVSSAVLKTLITLLAGLVGFLVFPDISAKLTPPIVSMFNFIVGRLSSEIMTQFLRLSRQSNVGSMTPVNPIGGIAITKPVILDTSSIIDGRILDIAKTGFLSGTLLVPGSVLTELQQVADSSDFLKRSRGRRGFEIIEELKKIKGFRLEVWDKEPNAKNVDDRLVKIAKSLNGKIITTDYNLNRVASAHGVTVLNVNDLANAVKTVAIPGEIISLKIIHIGKDPKQGVGYLPDGTMIVVEDGADVLGKETQVTVTKILQGSAGRMIFAKKV